MGSLGGGGFMIAGGFSGQRTQTLAAKIYKPARCKHYNMVKSSLDHWGQDLKMYERIAGSTTDDNKLYGIRQIVPEELEHDIMRNAHTLKTYDLVRKYIDEQVYMRRDMGPKKSSNLDSTHIMSDESFSEKIDEMYKLCMLCAEGYENNDLNDNIDDHSKWDALCSFLKGGGKGSKGGGGEFEGNCNHCGKRGHRLRDCWEKDKEMQQKGKGKGKDGGKGGGLGGGVSKGQWGGGVGGGKGFGAAGGKGQWGGVVKDSMAE